MTDATTARTLLADVTATGGLTLAERVAVAQVWALLEVGEAIGRLGDELEARASASTSGGCGALHGGVRGSGEGFEG